MKAHLRIRDWISDIFGSVIAFFASLIGMIAAGSVAFVAIIDMLVSFGWHILQTQPGWYVVVYGLGKGILELFSDVYKNITTNEIGWTTLVLVLLLAFSFWRAIFRFKVLHHWHQDQAVKRAEKKLSSKKNQET